MVTSVYFLYFLKYGRQIKTITKGSIEPNTYTKIEKKTSNCLSKTLPKYYVVHAWLLFATNFNFPYQTTNNDIYQKCDYIKLHKNRCQE